MTSSSDERRTHVDGGSPVWGIVWRAGFALIARSGPLLSMIVRLRVPTYESIVGLAIVGRKTGRPRPVTVALINLDGRRYVGHANGAATWVTNLGAMDAVTLTVPRSPPVTVHPTPLFLGPERDAVIRAGAHSGPIHVRPLYWASRQHILRAGVFYRLDAPA
ncbi:MAG TPA: hypothetical protein VGQ85_08185 [Candidatus Limnocylindrales bacterium]|nr:hypothetical protein [Candidatus Limnocylindrales bacterium]